MGFNVSDVTLYIHRAVQRKMAALANEASGEVSGLFKVEVDSDNDIQITDIAVLPQRGSSASTHLDMDAFIAFISNDIKQRLEAGETGELQTQWRGWFHSHPGTGSPSYSTTDDNTLNELAEVSADGKEPFFVGIVLSSDGKYMQGYICQWRPFKYYQKAAVKVMEEVQADREATEWAKAQLKEHMARPSPKSTSQRGGGMAGTSHGSINDYTWTRGRGEVTGTHRWFDNLRYTYNVDFGLWLPDPTENELREKFKTPPYPAVVPYLGPIDAEMKAVLLREAEYASSTNKRITKQEKGIRTVLGRRAERGSLFLVDAQSWSVCAKGCGYLTWLFSSKRGERQGQPGFCLGCERMEAACVCPAYKGPTPTVGNQMIPYLMALNALKMKVEERAEVVEPADGTTEVVVVEDAAPVTTDVPAGV